MFFWQNLEYGNEPRLSSDRPLSLFALPHSRLPLAVYRTRWLLFRLCYRRLECFYYSQFWSLFSPQSVPVTFLSCISLTVSAHSSFLTLQACYCLLVHHICVFKEHCFPSGRPVKYEGRKRGYDVIPVRTKDFEDKIQQVCKVRNDEWVETVRGR